MRQSIAALDLGTSKSIALVVEKDFAGKLSVIRTETLPSKNAIRRGRIYNSDEISDILYKLIRKLNNNPDAMQIEKFYVGIGGQSLHTQLFKTERIIDDGTVTQQVLNSIEEEANAYKPEFEDNLGIVSREYYADGHLVANPKGIVASRIEAHFLLIAGNPYQKRNLEKVFDKKEVSVAGYFVSPLATAEAVLTPAEKESGCALVEFGDGITSVSVYKNKDLKYLATLPLGGLAITKDIRSLNVSESEAEVLKIEHGSLLTEFTDNDTVSVNEELNPSRKIELMNLSWIIEAREDEIVKNVLAQIQASGYSQALNAGIVITGGGALLRNLPQYIRNQSGKEVRLADAKAWINRSDNQLSPADSCVIGLTLLGKENCLKEKTVKVQPLPEPQIFEKEEVEVVIKERVKPVKDKVHRVTIIEKIKNMFDEVVDTTFEGGNPDSNKNNNTAKKQ